MRLELKVTNTPNSKSKRPWERWAWLGSKTGSVLLLAQGRIKVLNLQERGSSIKKKVTKLSNLQNSAIITSTTRDGQYLLGYLESGDIFVWNKDQDTLRTIKGHPSISAPTQQSSDQKTESIQLFASNDLHNVLLVKGHRSIYLWEIDQPESALRFREVELKGTWSLIGGDKTPLPGADSSEAVSDAVFNNDPVLGRSCVWSVVFYQGDDIQISTVLIRWFEPWHHGGLQRHPAFSVRWLSSKHSIRSLSPSSWPVNHHGALAASYTNSGRVLAIALNQRSPHETKMAFVSPLTSAATVVDMKSCGCKTRHPHADHIKTYWISDMTWTHNDLFLVCITKRGALAILPRLGEPILLQSEGCSVEHPPAYFLPVLNLVTVMKPSPLSGDRPPSPTSSLTSESDEGRQRFSVSCHSSHPMILCSDGYLGLVMELPANLTCASILSDYLSEGATALNLMYSARDLGPVGLGSLRREPTSPNLQSSQQRTFSNMIDMLATANSVGLESTQSSGLGYNGPFGNMTSGKLVFDDSAMMASTKSLGFLPMGNHSIESLIQWTQMAALSAWGLGVSHAGPWDSRLEYLMQYTVKVVMALVWILLRKDDEIKLPTRTRQSVSGTEKDAIDQKLSKVLSLYKAILASSLWDSLGSHSMHSYLRLTRSLVKQLLKGQVCDQISMTRCCIAVLHSSEQVLSRVYTRRPVSEPSFHLSQLSFHPSDTMERALAGQRMQNLAIMSSSSARKTRQTTRSERSLSRTDGSTRSKRSKKRETRSETSLPTPKKDLALIQGQREPLSQGGAVSRRMIPTWKRLYRHINKLLECSIRAKGVSHFTRQQNELIQLLCYVQRKLHLHGYSVPLHLHSKWTHLSNIAYLKGCECYIKNLPAKAVRLWHLAVADPRPHRSHRKRRSQQPSSEPSTSDAHPPASSSKELHEDTRARFENKAVLDGEADEVSLHDQIVEASLLGILYTHLVEGELQRALDLADSLITCQNVGSVTAPERRGRRLPDLPRKDMQKLPPASPTSTPVYVPYLANSCQQRAVQSLARFMALYFTNRPLYVFPPCSASPLPPLHVQSKTGVDERQIQITHEAVTSSVRQQELSDKWTVNMTLNLLLVSGLVPEAVWLAHELGDWKSAFALSAVYSSPIQSRLKTKDSRTLDESLVLPPNLSPTNLLREGLHSVLQTPILDPEASPRPGKKVQRAGSFSGSQRRGSYGSLLDSPAMPIRKSSSVCSLVEEDKLAQVMLSQTLTDILTAATLSRQDPTHWLLESMMEECLTLAKGFTSLVPEEFYLPAPPYYCPQPEYIPNDNDPPEVLEEDDRRREINDLVQLILLVLNASHCSLPCARWYVEQLRVVQEKEKEWKAEDSSIELPAQLQAHMSYPVDILSGLDDPNNNLDSNGKGSVLKCFRDLCCLLWMLYVRDKLSLAVRKYQTSKERSTHVQQTTDPRESERTEKLLKPVLDWAECLYPFSRFLSLENEVNDILLTAIAELPLTKETVSILGRHFYDINDLPPFLEDKFGRLKEKLRRKKVPAVQKQKKQKEDKEVRDGETTPVVFEALMTHYKRQSKKRMLERNRRKASFRSLDDSVFEPDDAQESRSRIASKEEDDSVFDSTAGSSSTPQKQDGSRLSSEEARLFQVGSREFEGNSAYLHFLETFFLVTFGRQVQEDAFMSQTELPLIRSFHKQVLDSEIKKNTGRAQQKSSLPVVKPDDLQFGQDLDVTMDSDENQSVPSKIRGPGLFKKLFGGPLEREEVTEIPRLPLQRSNSQTSLTGSVTDSPRGQKKRQSSKRRKPVQPKRKREDCFVTITLAEGFKPVRVNLGKDFQQLGNLVDWLSKWSGRQPSKGFQKLDSPAEESKAVIQVKLPQQLILVSMWLLQHVYAPDTLQVEETYDVHASPRHEDSHGKVHFSFAGKRKAKKDSALSGRHRHSGRRKRVSSVSRRDKTKPTGHERSSLEDDHLPREDVPPVDLTRPISVGNIPAIVIEKSGSCDNLVDSPDATVTTAVSPNANDNHPLLERPPDEVGGEWMEESGRTSGKLVAKETKEPGKKRRQLPIVSEEKRRNSPNISQLLKGKMPISGAKKPKSRVKLVDTEEGKASKKLTLKKRSGSDHRKMKKPTDIEMTDFGEKNKTGSRLNAADVVTGTPSEQNAPLYVGTEDAVHQQQAASRSNLHGISDDSLFPNPHPDLASDHGIMTMAADAVISRRSSVDIIRRSSSGGGILSAEGHFYESSSSTSSPDVSSLEDSDDDDHGHHPARTTDQAASGEVDSLMKNAMEEDQEDGRSPSNSQSDIDKRSKVPRVGGKKEKNGDIKKLVRSEVKRIMEAQHQSMMSMLDTAGTLMLNNLEQRTNGQPHQDIDGSLSFSELPDSQNKTDLAQQGCHEPETVASSSNVTKAKRGYGIGGDGQEGKHTRTHDSDVQVEMGDDVASRESGTNGVPLLKLEDLASSREPAYHHEGGQQSATHIPGMIRGFPLLTIPKDSGRNGEHGLGVLGGNEYDLIPIRERDSARPPNPGREDIVLLRVLPERTGASSPPRSGPVEPPLYKQSFTYDTRMPHGPPNYVPSRTQPRMTGGMPLLRIPPEKDYKFPVPHHSNNPYSQVAQPRMAHQGGQTHAPPYPISQYGPPWHTPSEAWVNPPAGGTQQAYPSGKIDIPLLRIDPSKPAVPQLMHQVPVNSQVQSEYHPKTERTRINLPLLHLKDPEPQPPLQPNLQRPLHPKLPIVSPEEIIVYQKEKRRRELEREAELRKQNGGPMQLLHLEPEPTVDVLATTSRQRRRERLESKENDPRTGLDHGQKSAKIRKSDTHAKDHDQRKGRTLSKANDLILEEAVSSEEEEWKGNERPRVPPRARVVRVVPKENQMVSSRQRAGDKEEDDTMVDLDIKQGLSRPAVAMHDVETQVSALGGGYAIKPGSHDEALQDPDARPLLPTSAQIHYETVMKLQQPPPMVRTREAETRMKDVREAGTSMEGREGLDIIQERLARGRNELSKEGAKPTVEEVEEQYTKAATGLSKAGNIIAPDIFFGLRFRSGEEQASSTAGQAMGQPGSSGREFIHVADIKAEDVFRDIPQHPDSKDYRGRRRREDDDFQHPERDHSSGRSLREKDAKRRREDGDQEEDQTTIAELHYKSLFHRDAVPQDGLALLDDDDDEMDGAVKRKRIGDEVTRKLLEARLDKAERGMKLASEISSSRNQSKNRIQHQLAQMNERLGAIDEVSQSMQQDFNNTKLLLHTVENLSEAMAQRPADSRPRPDYSFKDYKEPQTDQSPKTPPLSSNHRRGDVGAGQREDERRKGDEHDDVIEEKKKKEEEEEDRAEDKDLDRQDGDDAERTMMTEGNLTLGISGISGVSDIIAEVIAGDDVDAEEFGLTEQQKRAAKKRVQTRHDSFNEEDLTDIPLASLTDRQLRQIFSPRSDTSLEEKTKPWPFAAKPEGRSKEERQKIKEWMERKRAQQIEEYKKKRGEKIEREHKPFRPKGDSLKQIPTSTKEIKKAEEEKKTKKQAKIQDHYEDRLAQAKDLMADIFEDKPDIPQRPLIEEPKERSSRLRKQASLRGTATPTARQTPRPSARTAVTPHLRSGADSQMAATRVLADRSNVVRNEGRRRDQQSGRPLPKGTYMFIDSEAYRGPAVECYRHADDHQDKGQVKDRQQEHPAYRGRADERPSRRSLLASMERSVQFADPRRSSEEDLQLVLAEMSDLVTPRSGDEEQENASSHHEFASKTYHKPKPFSEVVRVQRPEVTRKREGTPRKPKTYTDMLQEMKAEVSSSRAPSSVKAKQRLYGSTRLPGWNKNRKQYTKTPKTYTERLSEMKSAQSRVGQGTRLIPRPKPRPRQEERSGTATMTIGPSRRQQVERRGITPEPGPRSSTPYTTMLAELSNSGTHRGREPMVSPRVNPGMRAKPRAHEPVPYVDRLKQNAAEASATTSPKKYRTAYGARPVPTGTYYTHKAPPLRTPSPRHQPYEMSARQPGRAEDETSDVSGLSPWSVSDDVRRLLEEDDDLDEGLPTIREPQYEISDIDDEEYGDYAAAVNIQELEEIASVGSGSIMSNIDWDAVDKMIETVE